MILMNLIPQLTSYDETLVHELPPIRKPGSYWDKSSALIVTSLSYPHRGDNRASKFGNFFPLYRTHHFSFGYFSV